MPLAQNLNAFLEKPGTCCPPKLFSAHTFKSFINSGIILYKKINPDKLYGAAVVGVIGAAGLFLVEHYRHERQRQMMARDLARLDQEMRNLRSELIVLQSQSSRSVRAKKSRSKQNHVTVQHQIDDESEQNSFNYTRADSIISTTTDDYLSANFDSSDQEYYDISDDDVDVGTLSTSLENVLNEIDKILDLGTIADIEETVKKLEALCKDYSENAELLYRIGKAHYRIADRSRDKHVTQKHIHIGIGFCGRALKLAPNHPEIHKWYAVLVGSRAEFQSMQDRVADGHLFKKHVDIAIALNPNDPSLHHMLGRFNYEVAGLKWYERKIATALFGEPPSATYQEAIARFMEAERLANFEWRENKMMLAKCYICLGQYQEALQWLERAKNCPCPAGDDGVDDKVMGEINLLLAKYESYR